MIHELHPQYDSTKSFYGKATVHTEGQVKTLYSYSTKIACYDGSKLEIYGYFSPTTARHLNEFLQQNGLPKMTKKQINEKATPIQDK